MQETGMDDETQHALDKLRDDLLAGRISRREAIRRAGELLAMDPRVAAVLLKRRSPLTDGVAQPERKAA
jgi:hypothetical protein